MAENAQKATLFLSRNSHLSLDVQTQHHFQPNAMVFSAAQGDEEGKQELFAYDRDALFYI